MKSASKAAKICCCKALHEIVKSDLEKHDLSNKQVIDCSFDGASNMRGQYNGIQAKLKQENKNVIFVHCEVLKLNLVMSNATVYYKIKIIKSNVIKLLKIFLVSSHCHLHFRVTQKNASGMKRRMCRRPSITVGDMTFINFISCILFHECIYCMVWLFEVCLSSAGCRASLRLVVGVEEYSLHN